MDGIKRFERKCLLSLPAYFRLKAALRIHLEPDQFTRVTHDGRYLVRSVYYDTRDYRAYFEKEAGNYGRIKLRIRAYTDSPDRSAPISVEIKTRTGDTMTKYTARVTYDEYDAFSRTGQWPDRSDPVVMEFERLVRVRALVPVVLVQYRREGLLSRERLPLRVTIDHGVVSARSTTLFPDAGILKPHLPRHVILETKVSDGEPRWLTDIVKDHALRVMSNSKYVQGIEVIRPHMVTEREAVGGWAR